MYRIINVFFLVLFFSCGTTKLKETNSSTIKTNTVLKEEESVKEVNVLPISNNIFSTSDDVSRIMSFLASDDLQGRDSGSEGIEKAAVFIEKEFKKNGLTPYFSTYRDTISNFKKPAFNVVGLIEGNDPELKKEFLIIGAHYDHIGQLPGTTDVIANGANDNASGTTTVMEIARYFGKTKKNKRSILFVLFTAEEKGLLGSKHLAKKLKQENFNLYTMLNYEMVGVPLIGKDYLMYVTGYESSNLADIGNAYANEKIIGFLPKAKEFGLFKRSDNYPFHQEFNVPSQTFCTFDFTNFNHYHNVGDENELMDFEHMANIINKSIPMIEAIVNSTTKEIKY
ncbi:peptidase M28-like protein [Maribacter vaceletii]|uniref:Peptidase M28-like protein n=1 Tax=Maribacter vaceletii TaxID=1206816 RepID=A0A495DST0_9FLAO|nr:M28 family peptidase [Maribacter vaceletii]RKR07715.1 peptidase M28-like protein [Maribacter vaceletii]